MSLPAPGDERPGSDPAPSRSPLLAVLGAGDAAVAAVAHAFADAFPAAAENRRTVQQRVADLPNELDALRGRFSGDELRRALEAYRAQVEHAYAAFAGRGEETWDRLRGRAADAVIDATATTADVVEDAGEVAVDATVATADAVEDAGTAAAGAVEDTGPKPRKAPRRRSPAAE